MIFVTKKWRFFFKCWVDFCHKKVVIHCLHQIKEMHVLGFCHTKGGNLSLNGSWFLSQKVAIHVYIRVKLQRYLDFCHTKCGNFSLDGELIFVTKKWQIIAYIRVRVINELGFLSQKKWQFVSRWGVLPAGSVRRLGVLAICLAARLGWLALT